MAEVKLVGLSKIYEGGVTGLQRTDFSVSDGELMVVVGPSGCGKSTLLRLVAGLEHASSGELYIGDTRANDVHPKDRDVAMVFQNYALYPHMNAFDNMAFGLKMRRYPREEIEKRVRRASEMLGIESLLKRKPGQLSGGEKQRVALGRALVREPKVFLFDEPLSNLDAKFRSEMRSEIIRIHRELRTTMIYVTHDQAEAMTMGQRIAVMSRGRILQVGPPLEVYRRPGSRFVAGFIGSPSMNLLEGTLSGEGAPVFRGCGLEIELDGEAVEPGAASRPAVMGVRPEDLFEVSPEGAGRSVECVVDFSEPMGSETLVHVRAGGTRLTARLQGNRVPAAGEKLRLFLEKSRLHFFDGQTGERLN